MDLDTNKLEPAFDFTSCESSVLLHQSQAEVCIYGKTYSGLGKVCLDFLPCANIHLYGEFNNVPSSDSLNAMLGNKKMTSFSINSRQVNGFLLNISGDASKTFVKWGPKSEPINVIGDESTQMTRTVFHLFNFVNLIGIRRSAEQSGSSIRRIEHIDLVYD